MAEAQQYRTTRQVALVRMVAFCRSLVDVLDASYESEEAARIWRLYISAECPLCGITVCGDELRALAFPPCAELASAKTGRMRLGDCARRGCGAWHYAVHFWQQEGIPWPHLLNALERSGQAGSNVPEAVELRWLKDVRRICESYGVKTAAVLSTVFMLWLGNQLYRGGRIPFLREPEQFRVETTTADASWPQPLEAAEMLDE